MRAAVLLLPARLDADAAADAELLGDVGNLGARVDLHALLACAIASSRGGGRCGAADRPVPRAIATPQTLMNECSTTVLHLRPRCCGPAACWRALLTPLTDFDDGTALLALLVAFLGPAPAAPRASSPSPRRVHASTPCGAAATPRWLAAAACAQLECAQAACTHLSSLTMAIRVSVSSPPLSSFFFDLGGILGPQRGAAKEGGPRCCCAAALLRESKAAFLPGLAGPCGGAREGRRERTARLSPRPSPALHADQEQKSLQQRQQEEWSSRSSL